MDYDNSFAELAFDTLWLLPGRFLVLLCYGLPRFWLLSMAIFTRRGGDVKEKDRGLEIL